MPPAQRSEVESAAGLKDLAREQAALRRVATLVAEAAPANELFAAVAEELGSVVLKADVAFVGRYEPDAALPFVGGWSRDGVPAFVGQRVRLGGCRRATGTLSVLWLIGFYAIFAGVMYVATGYALRSAADTVRSVGRSRRSAAGSDPKSEAAA